MAATRTQQLVKTAEAALGQAPYRQVRLPDPKSEGVVQVDAVWTRDSLRPRWNNIAAIAHTPSALAEIDDWKERLKSWPTTAGILGTGERYLVLVRQSSGDLVEKSMSSEVLSSTLSAYRETLFTPHALSARRGELPLDFDLPIPIRSATFLADHRADLSSGLKQAIHDSVTTLGIDLEQLKRKLQINTVTPQHMLVGHVVRVAIAFLAARILEDKGFFGSNHLRATNDPAKLLRMTAPRANGFFQKALESLERLKKRDDALASIAAHLGGVRSFALVDDQDVGDLYECALREVPRALSGHVGDDLQQHYTPVAVARRMLEQLPLERIAPEERVVFDPAFGSGSLLLAASSRLAAMSDVPRGNVELGKYLAGHIAGNDVDPQAGLITHLRYQLVQQSMGDAAFPAPSKLLCNDYLALSRDKLGFNPKVVVANPPYEERGGTQLAVQFVEHVLQWLDYGAQFAFVLPQTFLTGSTHGFRSARHELSSRCRIFDIWQLPEQTVGLHAEQAVCVVLGAVGRSKSMPSIARAVYSRTEAKVVRQDGYLGPAWIAELDPLTANWASATAQKLVVANPTVPMGAFYNIFTGVTPPKNHPLRVLEYRPTDKPSKRYWKMALRQRNSVWADPSGTGWIIYDSKHLDGLRRSHSAELDGPKILVARLMNRDSARPLLAVLDTTGLCPDNNVFCIVPKRAEGSAEPDGWSKLSHDERLLWLLGLMNSTLGGKLTLEGRDPRRLSSDNLEKFRLPVVVDYGIVELMRKTINQEQEDILAASRAQDWRRELDRLVDSSYGATAKQAEAFPGVRAWSTERTKETVDVIGYIEDVDAHNGRVRLCLSGMSNTEPLCDWTALPAEMPGWALDGTLFNGVLSADISTYKELDARAWAFWRIRHPGRDMLPISDFGPSARQQEHYDLPDDLIRSYQDLVDKKHSASGLSSDEDLELESIRRELMAAHSRAPRSQSIQQRAAKQHEQAMELLGRLTSRLKTLRDIS